MSITRTITVFGACVLISVFAFAGASIIALQHLKVGGPVFQRIAAGKDIVADILPPPLYVVEAYLETELLVENPAELPEHKARLAQLHKDYDERHAYWKDANIPAELKELLIVKSDAAAREFWADVEMGVIPAVAAGDKAGVDKAMAKAGAAYNAHRAAIDEVVKRANDFAASQEAAAKSSERTTYLVLGALIAAILALVVGVILAMNRGVSRPIVAIARYMELLADGNYDRPAPDADKTGEIGAMARSIRVFRDAALERRELRQQQEADRLRRETERETAAVETRRMQAQRERVVTELASGLGDLARGDLTRRLDGPFPQEYEALRADFNRASDALRELVQSINGSTGTVRGGAHEIAQAADELSRRTEQQASTLEQTAAALEEVTVTVRETAARAEEATDAVDRARNQAEESGQAVGSAVDAMERIKRSSGQINQIIGVIDEIAFQTNLLALNAGVEAARAGDAGRGFAVVASEVRALAQRSADAAKEIKALISSSGREVEQGVLAVSRTGEVLVGIVEQVAGIDTLIGEIANGAREQSGALHEISNALSLMDQVTQRNAAMVEEATAAAHSLSGEAQGLEKMVSRFKVTDRGSRQAA